MNRVSVIWLLVACSVGPPALAQRGPSLVEVVEIVEKEVATGQSFVGTVMPTRRAVVGSAVDGRVVEFFVEEGDRVDEGQPLAQLLTATIGLELEAAQAELELRKQELAEMENGTLPTEIEQARARVDRARVASEYREKDRKRMVQLHAQNATSESELDEAISAALESKELYDEAKAAYQLALDGPRKEKIEQARAQVAIQDAIVRRLKDQIAKYTIVSRFAGYVTVKHSDVGEWMKQGNPVAEVVALDEVDVVAKVVEANAPYIHVGDSVRVEVPALSQRVFTGTVAAIVPQADVRSRTFPVKVRVKNEVATLAEPLLKAGMLARATLATGESTLAKLVPKDSIVLGGRTPTVWLVDAKSVESGPNGMRQANAFEVPVQLGVASGRLIQVQGDIPSSGLVVIKGNERIPHSRTGDPSPIMWTATPAGSAPSANAKQASNHVTD